jgi:hypothetical protein
MSHRRAAERLRHGRVARGRDMLRRSPACAVWPGPVREVVKDWHHSDAVDVRPFLAANVSAQKVNVADLIVKR